MKKNSKSIMSNVSERDKKFLFILGIILVLAGSYFLVFSPQNTKATEIKEENEGLESYVKELDSMIVNEETKKQEILTFNSERNALLAKFPSKVTNEKVIATIADLEDQTGIFDSQVTITMNNQFFDQATAKADGTVTLDATDYNISSPYARPAVPEETYPEITGYRTTVTLAFDCTDQELSDAMDYINQNSEKMSVDTINVGYDETSGNLAGDMTLCLYSVTGVDTLVYNEPEITGVSLGIVNIFGSKEVNSSKKKK